MSMSRHPERSAVAGIEPGGLTVNDGRMTTTTYTGRDADHLVTATIDVDGLVSRIQFGATALSRSPAMVECAVVAAVGAAQAQRVQAWLDREEAHNG
jgi:hypothetical protein